jgi:hypothetical protein
MEENTRINSSNQERRYENQDRSIGESVMSEEKKDLVFELVGELLDWAPLNFITGGRRSSLEDCCELFGELLEDMPAMSAQELPHKKVIVEQILNHPTLKAQLKEVAETVADCLIQEFDNWQEEHQGAKRAEQLKRELKEQLTTDQKKALQELYGIAIG